MKLQSFFSVHNSKEMKLKDILKKFRHIFKHQIYLIWMRMGEGEARNRKKKKNMVVKCQFIFVHMSRIGQKWHWDLIELLKPMRYIHDQIEVIKTCEPN